MAAARDAALLFGHNVEHGGPFIGEIQRAMPWFRGYGVIALTMRKLGAFLFGDVWKLVTHLGKVPDDRDRAKAEARYITLGDEHRHSVERLMPQK